MLIAGIAILSAFDIVATGVGVSLGYIQEGNPLMAGLFERSLAGSLVLVAAIVGVALWLVSTQIERFRWIRYAMAIVLMIKLGVAGLHLAWISMVV